MPQLLDMHYQMQAVSQHRC